MAVLDKKRNEKVADKILSQYLSNNKDFKKISSLFIELVIELYLHDLSNGQKLFIEYVLYDLYTLYRNEFIRKLEGVDSSPGSAKYEFISIFSYVTSKKNKDILSITQLKKLSEEEIKKKWEQISTRNIEYYLDKLKRDENKEALMLIAEKCIQKGYTTFSELMSFRRENQPFKMLIKYDERFTFFERMIAGQIPDTYKKEKKKKIIASVHNIIYPYPFSLTLIEFHDVIIKLLPHDHFLYVIDMEKIKSDYMKRSASSFMTTFIIPRALNLHEEKINRIRKLDKCLKSVSKDFCANYYIMDIDIDTLVVKAESKAIPNGFRRIIIRDILENGKLANLLSTQDIYISSIVKSMPFEGLLFDLQLDSYVEKYFKKYSKKIKTELKKNGIPYNSIFDKSNFDKSITHKVNIF